MHALVVPEVCDETSVTVFQRCVSGNDLKNKILFHYWMKFRYPQELKFQLKKSANLLDPRYKDIQLYIIIYVSYGGATIFPILSVV